MYAEYRLPARVVAGLLRGFPPEFFGNPVCGAPVPIPPVNSEAHGFAMKYGGGFDIHATDRLYGFVDYAFYHAIQDSIKPFDFHAVGGGIGFRW